MDEETEIYQKICHSLIKFEDEFSTNVLFAGLIGSHSMGLSNRMSDIDIFTITEKPITNLLHETTDNHLHVVRHNDYMSRIIISDDKIPPIYSENKESRLRMIKSLNPDSYIDISVYALPTIKSNKTVPLQYPSYHYRSEEEHHRIRTCSTYRDKDSLCYTLSELFFHQQICDWRGYVFLHLDSLIEENFKAIDVLNYLYTICQGKFDTSLKKSKVPARMYLYTIHSFLSMKWIIETLSLSPPLFLDLLKICKEHDVITELMHIYEQDQNSEIIKIDVFVARNSVIEDFLEKGLNEARVAIEQFAFTSFQKKLI